MNVHLLFALCVPCPLFTFRSPREAWPEASEHSASSRKALIVITPSSTTPTTQPFPTEGLAHRNACESRDSRAIRDSNAFDSNTRGPSLAVRVRPKLRCAQAPDRAAPRNTHTRHTQTHSPHLPTMLATAALPLLSRGAAPAGRAAPAPSAHPRPLSARASPALAGVGLDSATLRFAPLHGVGRLPLAGRLVRLRCSASASSTSLVAASSSSVAASSDAAPVAYSAAVRSQDRERGSKSARRRSPRRAESDATPCPSSSSVPSSCATGSPCSCPSCWATRATT